MALTLPRVSDVRSIIKTSLSDSDIQGFIDDASTLAEGCISSLATSRQSLIIKYLTAHLIAMAGKGGKDALVTSKKLGDASESYARGAAGEGYAGTPFGRQALAFDTTGCLAATSAPKQRPIFKVL